MDSFADVMKSWGPAIIGGIFLILVIALGAAATNTLSELDRDRNNVDLKNRYNSLAASAAVFGLLMVAAFGVQGFMLFRRYKGNQRAAAMAMFDTPELSAMSASDMLDSTF